MIRILLVTALLTGCASGVQVLDRTERSISLSAARGTDLQSAADIASEHCANYGLKAIKYEHSAPENAAQIYGLTYHCVP